MPAGCGETLAEVFAMQPDDVDLADTVEKLAQAITFHTGQVCCDATRWLVHESIYPEFVDACKKRLQQVVVGYQMDDATQR
jgi:aldehyde dehydrogenase (NAD+)